MKHEKIWYNLLLFSAIVRSARHAGPDELNIRSLFTVGLLLEVYEMNENKQHARLVTLVYVAILAAAHVVLSNVGSIPMGPYRVSLKSVATIMAGLWFGPVAGALCGAIGDIIGCLMKYPINPLITLAAAFWGVLPGLVRPYLKNSSVRRKIVLICASIVLGTAVSSLILTTAGLVLINGYSFYAIMPGRLIQFALMTPVYCIVSCVLYFSQLTALIRHTVGAYGTAD